MSSCLFCFYIYIYIFVCFVFSLIIIVIIWKKMIFFKTTLIFIHLINDTVGVVGVLIPFPHVTDSRIFESGS